MEWISVKQQVPPFDTEVEIINQQTGETCHAYNECYRPFMLMRGCSPEGYFDIEFEFTHWRQI
jgi:hypothetical protein